VDGFFAVSGFLIAASAMRTHVVRYLWQRFLRIFPAFWVCLIITALLAGPIGWLAENKPLSSYWTAPNGPFRYVSHNWFLAMRTWAIAGTPAHIPYPAAWDGSLWTLAFEFFCYLLVAVLAVTTLLRRRQVVLIMWALSWAISLGFAAAGIQASFPTDRIIRLVPIFFAGAVLWLYRERIPDSPVLFAGALLTFGIGTFLKNPDVLAGPPLAYLCIWASIHLPGKRIGTTHDISYGIYIYAFVVAQVLAIWHVNRWGYLPFALLTLAITLPLAALSCVAVEQPALRLKHWSPRLRPSRPELPTSSAPVASIDQPQAPVGGVPG
jgi:peptidoglycan/LPS O-acetylase OafA/YrhL